MRTLMSRRAFAAAAGALAFLGTGSKCATAQVADPRPPTVDTSNPKEVADGVWVVSDNRVWLVPNIGIIVGKVAALVVDCGLGPANGEKVLELARRLAGPRRLMLTLTHFHPEHGYGAQVFRRDATILYNRIQRDELAEKGARYIELFRKTQSAAAAAALDGTTIVMPDVIYDGPRTEVDLGGRIVELHSVGTAHTRGDQIVFLPKERILFAGDLIEERMFPIFPWFPPLDTDLDGARWMQVLSNLQRFDPDLIVPGHGDPGTIDIALGLASHIDSVSRRVRALRQAGKAADAILREAKPDIVSAYPRWEHPGLIDWEISYYAAQPA
ncbi:MBL fold metallo-hydrolase [Bradyrhizobium sp. B120]|uniref:MBL fold metallo-hydrolase n=1 Tax=Bradyrhizobium sp. B120 TaxID=3410088 RepID=UPI003B98497E